MGSGPRSFLIINPFGIGDVLFSTPLVRALANEFPSARIYYMCNRRTAPILNSHPLIAKTFIYHRSEFVEAEKKSLFAALKKYYEFIAQIRREHIDCCIDLSLGTPFSLFALLAGIPRRLGLDYKGRGRFLTKRVTIDGFTTMHVADYYLEVLKLLGNNTPRHNGLEIFVTPLDRQWAESFLARMHCVRPIIGIGPCGGEAFGRDAAIKRWPPEYFSRLLAQLAITYPGPLLVFSSPSEAAETRAIIDQTGVAQRCIAVVDQPLEHAIALIGQCDVFISNDTGLVHCAEALGRKTVILFSVADENVYGPYGAAAARVILMKTDIPCRPCYRNFRLAPCMQDKKCLRAIAPEEVAGAVGTLLSDKLENT